MAKEQQHTTLSGLSDDGDDQSPIEGGDTSIVTKGSDLADTGDEGEISVPLPLGEHAREVAIQYFQDTEFTEKQLKSLTPKLWLPILQAVQSKMFDLQYLEKTWNTLCPHADKYIFDSGTVHIYDDEGRSGVDVPGQFQEIWSYDCPNTAGPKPKRRRGFSPFNKVEDWGYDPLVCRGSGSNLRRRRESENFLSDKGLQSLAQRISSQLLLYRITVVFGALPQSEEAGDEKCCWAASLHHRDGLSKLTFRDMKGWVASSFEGTPDAGVDCLEVANFLCGNYISHPYGMLAGSRA